MNIQSRSYFHTLIINTKFSTDTDVKKGCLELLDFLIEQPSLDLETSFYFEELRKHVSLEIEDDDFIYSVFYLARPEVNILKQEFSAWKESVHDFVLVEDKNFILEMLRDKEYVNPFSGEELSSEEFEEQVLTFFTPTSYFLDKRNVRI